jgi:hypothetical protein
MDTPEAHPTFAVVAGNGAFSNYNLAERWWENGLESGHMEYIIPDSFQQDGPGKYVDSV